MSRVQLALDVDDLAAAIIFYTKLFGTEPAKVRDGYANFAIANPPLKLVLIENPGHGGGLNHLGVEVETSAEVSSATERLRAEGLLTDVEENTTCCYAVQDKVWVHGPDGEPWEVYTVLADAPTFHEVPVAAVPADCCAVEPSPAQVSLGTKPSACC